MDLEKLIELVRERDLLYNYNHKSYHDIQKKDAIWRSIGKKINQQGKECKKQWTSLRDSFRRNLKKRKLASDTSTPYVKKWKFEEEMSFIMPYLKERTVLVPSHDMSLSSDDDSEPTVDTDENMMNLKVEDETKQLLSIDKSSISDEMIKYLLETKKDAIETLFYSLAQTVKKMNPYYQALTKAKVCSIVSELELEYLGHQANTESTYTSISTTMPSPAISYSSINISTSVSSPQASSSQGISTELHTDIADIKPF